MPSKSKQNLTNQYSAKDIKYLAPREHVRLRPGMYIGGTHENGLKNLIVVAIDDCLERVCEGKANHIEISLLKKDTLRIADNSEGYPVTKTPPRNESWLELLLTQTFMGRMGCKFAPSGGIHGVGIQTVTALSSQFTATVKQKGYMWKLGLKEGLVSTPLHKFRPLLEDEKPSFAITFTPDFSIFERNPIDMEWLHSYINTLSYLLPDTTFIVRDLVSELAMQKTYQSRGLVSWIEAVTRYEQPLSAPISGDAELQLKFRNGQPYSVEVHFALQYVDADTTSERWFVNTVETPHEGTHVSGFHKALVEVVNSYLDKPLSLTDVKRGLIAILHLKHPDPQFESQTRVQLLNPEVEDAVYTAVKNAFSYQREVLEAVAHLLAEKSRKANYVRLAPDTNPVFKD